jgi:L-amino acid N-acyltransferase
MDAGAAITLREAQPADLPAILAIYNHAILHSTALWMDHLVDLANREAWFTERKAGGFPVLVASDGGNVLGYGSFAQFRAFDGYKHTIEHSIYIAEGARGKGLGRMMLAALIEAAQAMGKREMVGAITASNEASVRLHCAFGFEKVGFLPGMGYKFGVYHDLLFMQKRL